MQALGMPYLYEKFKLCWTKNPIPNQSNLINQYFFKLNRVAIKYVEINFT